MELGFTKVSLSTPKIVVGATETNLISIKECIKKSVSEDTEIAVFPENCLTGATLGSMGNYKVLLDSVIIAINELSKMTKNLEIIVVLGAPLLICSEVVKSAIVLKGDKILGVVPSVPIKSKQIKILKEFAPISTDIIFYINSLGARMGITFGEGQNCAELVKKSANFIVNLDLSRALIDSYSKKIARVNYQSESLSCVYAYLSSGMGESVSAFVASGEKITAENGNILCSSEGDEFVTTYFEADFDAVNNLRAFSPTFNEYYKTEICEDSCIDCNVLSSDAKITRYINPLPFVPSSQEFDRIWDIIGRGIYSRMREINIKKVIIGLSGGLDSTIVLIAAVKTFIKYNLPIKNIIAVTMGGFGSSKRTGNNARKLIAQLGISSFDAPISEAVKLHLAQIGHSGKQDVTYENAQARERTQILLDMANAEGALMLGTGDLSEVALGWSTFGGDQTAHYNPNSSVSKTLIRALLRNFVFTTKNNELASIINDIISTPISPELVPNQETEALIGSYEVHDFFLFNLIGMGFSVTKVFHLTTKCFPDIPPKTIKSYLKTFIKRFFSNQFKRTASCDGIQLSPYDLTDKIIHSDFSGQMWMSELEKIVVE